MCLDAGYAGAEPAVKAMGHEAHIRGGAKRGGSMIPKVDCCALAFDGGVKNAHIIDGRIPHALLIKLFTGEGIGTKVFNQGTP